MTHTALHAATEKSRLMCAGREYLQAFKDFDPPLHTLSKICILNSSITIDELEISL